ncbi:heme ABC transporter ATP-binding protein [Microvirga antarctica]|uniref:heme ABC transporter ATP-binding protein n=1 Tax=Microvirga antarctica TaxID=2819233 RepID=UPI001B316D57|nr:heme ABC transporter ATP-binding protein [Microvirga antarctica]
MSAVLDARGIGYWAAGRWLVDKIDFQADAGRLSIIVGPNGAGKSTLLRVLCGELTPTCGEVCLDGRFLRETSAWRIAHLRAVMSQSSQLSLPFTVLEVVRLGVEGIGIGLTADDRLQHVEAALARADIADFGGRNYQTLSGGERQRVHFARVLAQLTAGATVEHRQVLFLDEPIASLDLKHQLGLLQEARRLADSGLAVVAVLHDLQLAASLADDLALLWNGRLVARGCPQDVLTPSWLADVFGIRLASSHLPKQPWRLVAE